MENIKSPHSDYPSSCVFPLRSQHWRKASTSGSTAGHHCFSLIIPHQQGTTITNNQLPNKVKELISTFFRMQAVGFAAWEGPLCSTEACGAEDAGRYAWQRGWERGRIIPQ